MRAYELRFYFQLKDVQVRHLGHIYTLNHISTEREYMLPVS